MKNVFLDTNILIDYVLNRPGGNDAEQLFMHGRRGDVSLSASLLTIANMAYILKGKICSHGDRHLGMGAGLVMGTGTWGVVMGSIVAGTGTWV